MSNRLSDQTDQQDCPLHEQPHQYIDEDISITSDQKSEQEAKTPLMEECSMPSAPSVIAHRPQQRQQQQHTNNNYNNDAIAITTNGHHYHNGTTTTNRNNNQSNGNNNNNNNNNNNRSCAAPIAAITMPTNGGGGGGDQQHQANRNKGSPAAAMVAVAQPAATHPSRKKGTSENDQKSTTAPLRCCCGHVQIRHVAIVLGVVEFVFFASQLIVAFVDLFDNADDFGTKSAAHGTTIASTLSTLLTIVSLSLAIAAAMLLLSGVHFRSPYLLVPHILMQFAFMIASLVIIGYLFSWWFGGFKIRISAIVYENSEKGYQGIITAKDRSPIRGNFVVDEFNVIVLIMIIFCGIFFVFQLWLYHLIISLFRELLRQPKQVSLSPTHSDTVDSCTTVMMMSTVSSHQSSPNNGSAAVVMNGHHHHHLALPHQQQCHHFPHTSSPEAHHQHGI